MSSRRGLPGFSRRSRRRDDFDDVDDENTEDDDDGDNNTDGSNTIICSDNGSSVVETGETSNDDECYEEPRHNLLDPSRLAQTSAEEDFNTGWTGSPADTAATHALNANEYESGGENSHGNKDENHSVSTLGESDPVHNNNSNNYANKRSSVTKTYRETQFEKILNTNNDNSNNNKIVKMAELKKIAWNGIPVRLDCQAFYNDVSCHWFP